MTALFRTSWLASGFVVAVVAAFTAISGCDLVGTSGTATMRVLLTDNPFPFDLVESANVTIERVEIVSESEGVINVTTDWTEPQEYNLLELRDGVTALLGEVEIPEGVYEQIRLVVGEEASVVMNAEGEEDAVVYDLKIPSGTETGVKIPLHGLDVEQDSYVTLTLDFVVDESFIVLGNSGTPNEIQGFNFKPVVKLLEVELDGVVEDAEE